MQKPASMKQAFFVPMKRLTISNKKFNSEELKQQLLELKKTPGVCIFIDLVESTKIKYEHGLETWGTMINNTFNILTMMSTFSDNLVKGIGDELMIYIPLEDLNKFPHINTHLALFEELESTIFNINNLNVQNSLFKIKVALHSCSDVYNMSYIEGHNDYYGKDIDIAARLMQKANPDSLVLSASFMDSIINESKKLNRDIPQTIRSSEKIVEQFKGVPVAQGYYIVNC